MVRTDVGLRCEECDSPAPVASTTARSRRRLYLAAGSAVVGVVVLVFALLIAGRSGDGETAAAPGPVVGVWEQGSALTRIRGSTSALPLPDGSVAVVGGGLGSVPLAATEIFDPRTGTWTTGGRLENARRGHGAVLLDDGRALLAGGFDGTELLASAEMRNPATGRWMPTGQMTAPRLGHTMTVLGDGTVLVTGGTGTTGPASRGSQTVQPSASAEIFTPRTGTWKPVDDMLVPRFEHTATLLPDGRVLIAGGLGVVDGRVQPVAAVELYDPNTRTFSRTSPLVQARSDHAAVALDDGRVLVVGGDAGDVASAGGEVYNPAIGGWVQAASLHQPRRGHSATLLADGTVLVAGGEFFTGGTRTSLAAAERYDPAEDVWSNAGRMACPRSEHGAALLPDGSVLIVAGDATFPGKPPIAQSCVDLYRP